MQQRSTLVRYQTTDEDDPDEGLRLGCNGTIHILIEPLLSENGIADPTTVLRKAVDNQQPVVIVTLFSLKNEKGHHPGTSALYADETFQINRLDEATTALLQPAVERVFQNKVSAFAKYQMGGETFDAFIEYIEPALSLHIVGSGYDVVPLIKMANIMGWEVQMVTERPSISNLEMPSCKHIVTNAEQLLEQVTITSRTAFVLMSHNYQTDKRFLRKLLSMPVSYIGMLGPKTKLQKMLKELEEEGHSFSEEVLARVHSPVGLDLGGETAEEIALAIAGEVLGQMVGSMVLPPRLQTATSDGQYQSHTNLQ